MNDIGYTVVDMMLKLFIFARISAVLLLAGATIYAVWIWGRRKMISFLIGLCIGCVIGLFIFALLSANKR